ncbi:hypothetical protein [Mycoplasmoides gallisepticum]|uniref:hypothetical protein n=1 Tax=Mycoplasmoides gallisepticum TaxID=2096 RepID=UPI003364B8EB
MVDPNINNNQSEQLQATRNSLATLLNGQTNTLSSYNDYAKLKQNLMAAYSAATTVQNNENASLENLRDAVRQLKNALNTVNQTRTTFNNENGDLIQKYHDLETALNNRGMVLEGLENPNYQLIKTHLTGLYDNAQTVVDNTLIPAEDVNKPVLQNLQILTQSLGDSTTQESLMMQKLALIS